MVINILIDNPQKYINEICIANYVKDREEYIIK